MTIPGVVDQKYDVVRNAPDRGGFPNRVAAVHYATVSRTLKLPLTRS